MDKKESPQGLSAVVAYIISRDISIFEKILVIGLVLAYIFIPFDLIPDVTVVSWLDDIGVGTLFIAYCIWRMRMVTNAQEKKAAEAEKEKELEEAKKSVEAIDVKAVEISDRDKRDKALIENKKSSTMEKDSRAPAHFDFFEINSSSESKREERNRNKSEVKSSVGSEQTEKPFFFKKKHDE